MLSRHIAISPQGVRKAFGRVRRFGVALAAGAFVAIIGLVGAPSPALAIPETTVSTVSPSGMTINLFDYWVTDASPTPSLATPASIRAISFSSLTEGDVA